MAEKILIVRCPVSSLRLNRLEVPLFRLGGQVFLKSSDLGRLLGFAQPASAISHLRDCHREEIEPHICRAWLGVQRGPQNLAKLISLQGCALLAAKVTKPEAKTAQAAFAALQASITPTNQEEENSVSREEAKKQAVQTADAYGGEDAVSRVVDAESGTSGALPVQVESGTAAEPQELPVVDGPVKVVDFHGQEVPVFEVNGELYLTGEDLGNMLGLVEPRIAVRKIFDRHREELSPHTCVTKLVSQVDHQQRYMRLYSEEGCYLIAMFARTETAKEVRRWLASLPRKIRQVQEEAAPEKLEQVRDYFFKEIVPRIFRLLSTPVGSNLGYAQLERLTQLRAFGLITQREAARLYNISVETVRSVEREMSAILGLEIKPLNQFQRDRNFKQAIESLLEYRKAQEAAAASLEAPRNRKKMH